MAKAEPFQHISIAAVKVLAQLAARKAVESEAKAKGIRTTPVEVYAQADRYLQAHPKLISEARDRAQRLGLTERNSRQK